MGSFVWRVGPIAWIKKTHIPLGGKVNGWWRIGRLCFKGGEA